MQLIAVSTKPFTDATALALTGDLQLETWPEGEVVPTTFSVNKMTAEDQSYHLAVSLSPNSPLPDRWYALHAISEVAGVNFRSSMSNWTHPKGGWMARFRPGQETIVSSISKANKGSLTSIHVSFSERVGIKAGVTPDQVLHVESAGKVYGCEATPMPAADETFKELIVFCAGPDIVPQEFSITIPDVFTSNTGVITPRTIAVAKDAFTLTCGEDCIQFHP